MSDCYNDDECNICGCYNNKYVVCDECIEDLINKKIAERTIKPPNFEPVTVSASVSASSLDDWEAMNALMRRLIYDAEQEWLKAFVRRAKKGILRALTEDYKYQGSDGKTKHNSALFDKTSKWQVYNDTNLTMVMDAVVVGLYAAYGESVVAGLYAAYGESVDD